MGVLHDAPSGTLAGTGAAFPPMSLSETTTRTLVAAIGIPVAAALVLAGGWVLAALVAVLAVLAALEFYSLAEHKQVRALRAFGAAVAGLFVVFAAWEPSRGPDGSGFASLIMIATLGLAVAAIWMRGVSGQPLLAVSVTLAGAIYAGGLLSFALFLRHLPGHSGMWHGTALLFTPILLTWVNDTFAYFVGRAWGTRKLIPSVSPGKTVQGAVGALAGTLLVALGLSFVLRSFATYQVGLAEAAVLGLLISVAAQVGDLAESLFKRDAGVKDSGKLLPGHGGALDRFDSLLFTLPLGYLFFRFVIGVPPGF